MRASTNIDLKDRKTYTVDTFRGCDLSTVPSKVSKTRASRMENFVIDDTLMHKRNGWIKKFGFGNTGANINGIWNVQMNSTDLIIVHHGTHLDLINKLTYGVVKTFNNVLADSRSQAIFNDNKLFIIDGQNFKVLYYNVTPDGFVLVNAYNLAYVPTTTIGITAYGQTGVRKSYYGANVLTRKRKNTLLGVNGNSTYAYQLDGKFIYEITGSSTSGGDLDDIPIYSLSGDVTVDVEYLSATNQVYTDSIVFLEGTTAVSPGETKWRTTDEQDRDVFLEYNPYTDACTLTIYGYKPLIEGRDNITVTYEADFDIDYNLLGHCTCMTTFGIGGNNDRLFLAGNPAYPNIDRWSEMDNFLYFPDTNYCVCGTSQTRIIGYTRLSDSVLAVLKEESGQEASVYYRTAEWLTQDSDNDGVTEYEGLFKTTAGAIGKGLTSPYCVSVFNGDNLFLSNDGIYGLTVSGNTATTQRYARERSRSVNKALASANHEHVVGFPYNDRFFVSMGNGDCYVADSRYKYSASDDIDGSFNYEWFHLTNVPARVFANVGGELWFGDFSGNVCAFDDAFSDRLWEDKTFGQGTITIADEKISYNGQSLTNVRNNERVDILSNTGANFYAKVIDGCTYNATTGKWTTSAANIVKLYDGRAVVTSETPSHSGMIKDLDKGNLTFTIYGYVPSASITEGISLYENLVGKTMYITDLNTTNSTFKLKRTTEDATCVDLVQAPTEATLRLYYLDAPVVAKWYSGLTDFGTSMYRKTLLSMTVETEPIKNSEIAMGYDTTRSNGTVDISADTNTQGTDYFDTSNFSFTNYALLPELNNSFTTRLNERNANFVRFRFVSENDKDCGLVGFSVQYKINNKNRGVM